MSYVILCLYNNRYIEIRHVSQFDFFLKSGDCFSRFL